MRGEDYNLWLCSIGGIGSRKLMALREAFADSRTVYEASERELSSVRGIRASDAKKIVESRERKEMEELKQKMAECRMKCVTFFSADYPEKCRFLYNPPKKIFYKGNMMTEKTAVAIVGARDCSVYGKEMARWFGSELGRAGVAVISGMARGVDGWAHQGALEGGGVTYAVLGNSVEICYPAEHAGLYRSIERHGGILSEYPPGTKAAPAFFPRRNRIISALAEGILVVEARKKSGSLITVSHALEQGKDIFVIPGRVGDSLSEGCNDLIKQGAFLVTSPWEIIEYYGIVKEKNRENFKNINFFLETTEKMVYANLSLEPKRLTQIAGELAMDSIEVTKIILSLQKKKLVREIGNHYYVRNVI